MAKLNYWLKKKGSSNLKQKKKSSENINTITVAVVMGSDSDFSVMKDACLALKEFGVPFSTSVLSAHRMAEDMVNFAKSARDQGINVIIAGAGGAAHLPGMIAALTELPVIGVPIPHGPLQGNDALLSIVQMPKGVPVATVAIGGAWNAGLLATQILGVAPGSAYLDRVRRYKDELRQSTKQKKLPKI
jgi:5-(carboxyamino)imidazole ribonucleotide mutase